MTNNDLLRRLRYALRLKDADMARIWGLASGGGPDASAVVNLLKREDESGFVTCEDQLLSAFLDGLIIDRRGPREPGSEPAPEERVLNNNTILRKLRIALKLNDGDMLAILARAGVTLSKSELSALFRAVGHRNYKPCGDQLLRNFVTGLTGGEKR